MRWTWIALAACCLFGSARVSGANPADGAGNEIAASDRLGEGALEQLVVHPASAEIRGDDRLARLVVTGLFSNGGVWDLTRKVTYSSTRPEVATVDAEGVVKPLRDGDTLIRAQLTVGDRKLQSEAEIKVVHLSSEVPIHFANDIVPIFSKHGCNAGGCHGKSGGQNGFRLSLFGFFPEIDYDAITRESRGRRVFPLDPDHSLLLRKPAGDLPHGGGVRFEPSSSDYELLRRWIRAGCPQGSPDAPSVESISVYPRTRMLSRKGKQQLRVVARFTDGRLEDVTARAQYSSGEPDYLEVTSQGLVSALNVPGHGSVLVKYLGRLAVFEALIPSGADLRGVEWPAAAGFVDEHVFRRLRQLGIPPSALVDDVTFHRRVRLDVTGTLPTPEEVRAFLADRSPGKRAALVDRLVAGPESASFFALLWADVLRNRRGGEERATPFTIGFHRWIYESLAANKPFDEIVREILCAEGSPIDNPPVAWYRSLESPKELVDDTAQVFLGTRMQCARCHHHPFEKWGQDDYWLFANFFSRINRRNDSGSRSFSISLRRGDSRFTDDEPTSASHQKTYIGLKLPGGERIEEPSDRDPREVLADWIVSPSNPLFARSVVNRYWKHFFGRGIVEPEDDLRETNPPSNPELLEALAQDFAAHHFDLRHLVKSIVLSNVYQLDSLPVELNRFDRQNFSHYQVRRLPAEVLVDAIDQVTGRKTRFPGARRDARAIELPDETSRNYFLEVFGKPERASACSCERSGDVTLAQIVYLLNSREIQEKLSHDEGRAALLARDARPLGERVEELFLAVFSRPPTAEEVASAERHFESAREKDRPAGSSRKAWEDLLWALVNSKELYFNR